MDKSNQKKMGSPENASGNLQPAMSGSESVTEELSSIFLGNPLRPKVSESASADSGTTGLNRTPCEVWTRVMGYHRPVQNFNIGKKSEHYSRKHFSQTITANHNFTKKFKNK